VVKDRKETGQPKSQTVTMLEAQVEGCDAEAYLNGIPLALLLSSRNRSVSIPAMQYLVAGDNHVMLAINPGPTPESSLEGADWTAPEEAQAAVRLVTYPVGAFPGDPGGMEHLNLYWAGDGQDGGTRRLEGVVNWANNWPVPAGPWAWESAQPLDLETSLGAIEAFITRVHAALEARDAGFMLQLSTDHLGELAAAYTLDLAAERQTGIDVFAEEFGRPDWAMQPLEPKAHDLRLCAGGRLVECVRADREPILRAVPTADGEFYFFPMMLGAVGGQLRLLR